MINQITVVGYVGKDPDIRAAGEAPVANFSIATTETWTDKITAEKKEETEWHNVACFGTLAKVVENNVKKGMQMYVQGKVKTQKWTDKDGVERTDKKIIAATIRFLGAKSGGQKANGGVANAVSNGIMDDLIPF